jgi:hypothetical protein
MIDFASEYGDEFKRESMYIQLGRIVDSESARAVVPANKFNPVESVITDDGKVFKVKASEAQFMREKLLLIPTVTRAEVLKQIQTAVGFKEFRSVMKQLKKGV